MHHWTDDVITARHPSTQATAMSIDVSGNLALLGSRRNLTLVDLNKPKEVLKRINLNGKWDITRVIWNPSLINQHYFLTTYNQLTDLWCYNQSSARCIATFQGHTRVVCDVDWSGTDPHLFSTCSLDQYIYLWDIRETKRPKLVTSTVSGASRVRWNKFNGYTIASSHDGNIRIWDIRNGKAPIQYITAHVSKINYLDWSPRLKHQLCSASQDMTMNFWNTSSEPRTTEFQIQVKAPVYRAEYTPFGTAIASVAFRSYRETPFTLWNIDDTSQPVHTFTGHTDVVLDFQWRKNSESNWQLVTWSKDQILRLYPLDYSLFVQCGGDTTADQFDTSIITFHQDHSTEENNKALVQFTQFTSSVSSAETQTSGSAAYSETPEFIREPSFPERNFSTSPSTYSSLKSRGGPSSFLPDTLDQEFRLLNVSLPCLTMNEMDRHRRSCTVTLRTTMQFFVLNITFPISYPNNDSPTFKFLDYSESISKENREKLLLTLSETAQHHVRNNRGCLEPCLRQLTSRFCEMSYSNEENEDISPSIEHTNSSSILSFPFGSNLYRPNLHNIPFPRTSGAKFSKVGYLVIFMRPTHLKGFHSVHEKTPRSLKTLTNHRRSTSHAAFERPAADSFPETPHISLFYYKEKRSMRRSRYYSNINQEIENQTSLMSTMLSKPAKAQQLAGKVVVIDLTRILPISRGLASAYIVPEKHNFSKACAHNKEKAVNEGMSDLVQLWSYVAYLPTPYHSEKVNEFSPIFQSSPLGRAFLLNLFEHYSKLKDAQTLAMLACTFGEQKESGGYTKAAGRPSRPYVNVKRSMSHQSFDFSALNTYGLHKSPSDSRFSDPEQTHFLTMFFQNVISKSPSDAPISKFSKTPTETYAEEYKNENTKLNTSLDIYVAWQKECQMLDLNNEVQYNAFKKSYCDFLQNWKMNAKVVEIQKHVQTSSFPNSVVFKAKCPNCEEPLSCLCPKHQFPTFMHCVICCLPVKSLWSFCAKCHHGGHLDHMQAWFAKHNHCPSQYNCSCDCVAE